MEKLKNETFLIFTLAAIQFSHVLDFVVMMPLGPVLMRTLDIGPASFALLVSVYNISAGTAGILYAIIADKYDRKASLIFCFVGFILGTALCGLTHDYYVLLMARIVAGAFGGVLTSVIFAIVTDLIPFKRRGSALSIIMSAFSVASVIGVPLGLIIAEAYNWQSTFIFIAAVSVLVLIVCVMIVPSVNDHVSKDSLKENIIRLKKLTFEKDYLRAYTLIGINILSIFMIIPFIAPYAIKNVGLLESDLKFIYLVGGICTVITARIIGKLTDSKTPIKVFSFLVPFSCIPIYFMTNMSDTHLYYYLVASSLFMMFVSGRMIPLMTMVSEIASLKDRGTFMGILNSVRSFATSIATLIAGFIIIELDGRFINYDTTGYISMFLGFVTLILAFKVNKILSKKLENDKTAS